MSRYPRSPQSGAAAIVIDAHNRILLIQRGKAPKKGLWTFPGGHQQLGETIHAAARRETLEETGIVIETGPVVDVVDYIHHDATGAVEYHYTIVDILARPVAGKLEKNDDAANAKWVPFDQLDSVTDSQKTREVFAKSLKIAEINNFFDKADYS